MRPVVPCVPQSARERRWRPDRPLDLDTTLGPIRRGRYDLAYHRDRDGSLWRATRTPEGPATVRLRARPADAEVRATAWGPGADWVLDTLPRLLGEDDDARGFEPLHPVVREAWRRNQGWRVPRTGLLMESLVPTVLEQKVTNVEARRAWSYLVRRYGEPAPGPPDVLPRGLTVPPDAATWRRVPSWEWHRAGVDQSRSRTVLRAAGSAGRLEQLVALAHAEASDLMQTVPGIGVWTAAEVAQRALGDPDAVSVGDYHLAKYVGMALVGERVDDDGMLELLEPYRGHRYRAVRMIELAGVSVPRHGPRLAPRDFRRM